MAKPTSSATLPCPQCGYENEPERVYCHNCGTKLDRSLLPKPTESAEESLAATRKRIKQMTAPGQGWATFKTAINTLIWAALIAALYLLAMPPERLPSREKEAGANLISVMIDDALQAPNASTLQFSEADISQHMRNRVRGVTVIPGLDFKRAYALINDGKITVGVQQELFGYPLYSTVEYELSVVSGALYPKKVGQHFGRLGIDPRIPKVDQLFESIWAALKRERLLMERAQAIKVTKDAVYIALKPAAPTPR
jgi:hypothetical protein